MKALTWHGELEFAVDGVEFQCVVGDYSGKTTRDRFMLLKNRAVLEQYAAVLGTEPPKHILEFGIFQGGSPALFTLWFEAEKFVGVDLCQPVAAFDEFCRTHERGHRIRSFYEVAQTDQARITQIVQSEFGDTPLDLIIDDASHQYDHSRRTFEIAFPYLRPGGTYVIEDWGWGHWSNYALPACYARRTSLALLIMELTMLCASRPDLVSEVRVFPEFAFIRKSPQAPPLRDFSLDGLYLKRNVELVGIERLNLRGIARLAAQHMMHRVRRRLSRTGTKLQRALRRR